MIHEQQLKKTNSKTFSTYIFPNEMFSKLTSPLFIIVFSFIKIETFSIRSSLFKNVFKNVFTNVFYTKKNLSSSPSLFLLSSSPRKKIKNILSNWALFANQKSSRYYLNSNSSKNIYHNDAEYNIYQQKIFIKMLIFRNFSTVIDWIECCTYRTTHRHDLQT
jgi:hypothetical protein